MPAAAWAFRSAALGLLLAIIAVAICRAAVVDGRSAIAVLGAGLLCAVLALVLAGRTVLKVWQTGQHGTARAIGGVVLGLVVLAYPGWLAVAALRLPFLNDVTTDLADPPNFSTSPAARAARGGVVHESPSAGRREAQRRAYPNLLPIILDLSGSDAYAQVLRAVASERWQVVEASPPKGKFGIGHVDAVARSRIMGFPEDVAIRVRPLSGQTRIDVRIASRLEPHDFGGNALRISAFADDLQSAEE